MASVEAVLQSIQEGTEQLQSSENYANDIIEYCFASYTESDDRVNAAVDTRRYVEDTAISVADRIGRIAKDLTDFLEIQDSQLVKLDKNVGALTSRLHCAERVLSAELYRSQLSKRRTSHHAYQKTAIIPDDELPVLSRPLKEMPRQAAIDFNQLSHIGTTLATNDTPRSNARRTTLRGGSSTKQIRSIARVGTLRNESTLTLGRSDKREPLKKPPLMSSFGTVGRSPPLLMSETLRRSNAQLSGDGIPEDLSDSANRGYFDLFSVPESPKRLHIPRSCPSRELTPTQSPVHRRRSLMPASPNLMLPPPGGGLARHRRKSTPTSPSNPPAPPPSAGPPPSPLSPPGGVGGPARGPPPSPMVAAAAARVPPPSPGGTPGAAPPPPGAPKGGPAAGPPPAPPPAAGPPPPSPGSGVAPPPPRGIGGSAPPPRGGPGVASPPPGPGKPPMPAYLTSPGNRPQAASAAPPPPPPGGPSGSPRPASVSGPPPRFVKKQ